MSAPIGRVPPVRRPSASSGSALNIIRAKAARRRASAASMSGGSHPEPTVASEAELPAVRTKRLKRRPASAAGRSTITARKKGGRRRRGSKSKRSIKTTPPDLTFEQSMPPPPDVPDTIPLQRDAGQSGLDTLAERTEQGSSHHGSPYRQGAISPTVVVRGYYGGPQHHIPAPVASDYGIDQSPDVSPVNVHGSDSKDTDHHSAWSYGGIEVGDAHVAERQASPDSVTDEWRLARALAPYTAPTPEHGGYSDQPIARMVRRKSRAATHIQRVFRGYAARQQGHLMHVRAALKAGLDTTVVSSDGRPSIRPPLSPAPRHSHRFQAGSPGSHAGSGFVSPVSPLSPAAQSAAQRASRRRARRQDGVGTTQPTLARRSRRRPRSADSRLRSQREPSGAADITWLPGPAHNEAPRSPVAQAPISPVSSVSSPEQQHGHGAEPGGDNSRASGSSPQEPADDSVADRMAASPARAQGLDGQATTSEESDVESDADAAREAEASVKSRRRTPAEHNAGTEGAARVYGRPDPALAALLSEERHLRSRRSATEHSRAVNPAPAGRTEYRSTVGRRAAGRPRRRPKSAGPVPHRGGDVHRRPEGGGQDGVWMRHHDAVRLEYSSDEDDGGLHTSDASIYSDGSSTRLVQEATTQRFAAQRKAQEAGASDGGQSQRKRAKPGRRRRRPKSASHHSAARAGSRGHRASATRPRSATRTRRSKGSSNKGASGSRTVGSPGEHNLRQTRSRNANITYEDEDNMAEVGVERRVPPPPREPPPPGNVDEQRPALTMQQGQLVAELARLSTPLGSAFGPDSAMSPMSPVNDVNDAEQPRSGYELQQFNRYYRMFGGPTSFQGGEDGGTDPRDLPPVYHDDAEVLDAASGHVATVGGLSARDSPREDDTFDQFLAPTWSGPVRGDAQQVSLLGSEQQEWSGLQPLGPAATGSFPLYGPDGNRRLQSVPAQGSEAHISQFNRALETILSDGSIVPGTPQQQPRR